MARTQRYNQNDYIYDNVARAVEVPKLPSKQQQKQEHRIARNREKASRMNFAYVLFLSAALVVCGFTLVSYIRMESAITSSVKQIAVLESELNTLKQKNDEAMSRVECSIDLDEIRRIAITELGMTYANDGQVIEIPSEGSDYVRQYAEIQK